MPSPYDSRSRPYSGRPRDDWPEDGSVDRHPPLFDREALDGLPVPVRLVVSTALLPLEAAVTSVNILKNTEALLGELVFHLRALRPAVAAASRAYADGHFDPVIKTFDQIQQGTQAISFVWAPLGAVRDVISPGQAKRQVEAIPPASLPSRIEPVVPIPPVPPTTMQWLGMVGGRVVDQAAALPGGALFTRPLRRPGQSIASPQSDPDPTPEPEDPGVPPADLVAPAPEPSLYRPVIERAGGLVPGPVRRLLGRG
jgi:hypothetical protein